MATTARPEARLSLSAPLTAERLTAALRESGMLPRGRVRTVGAQSLGADQGTTSRLVRLRLEYDGAYPGAPKSLVAKLPREAGPVLDVVRRFRLYEREARFYAELAAGYALPTPRLVYQGRNESGDPFLLLEDMAAREGDLVAGAGLAELRPIVEAIAPMHAAAWDAPGLKSASWLPRPNARVTVAYSLTHYPTAWNAFCRSRGPGAAVLDAGKRLSGDKSVLDRLSEDPCTLTHGDLRMNNLLFAEGGQLRAIIDWQSVTFARGAMDLASLLISNVRPEQSAAVEAVLLPLYHGLLCAGGVRGYSLDACWTDYRLAALAQFAGMVMQSAFVDLGGDRQATVAAVVGRPMAAVSRLDLVELLAPRRNVPMFSSFRRTLKRKLTVIKPK